jgi:hypothetical protein
MTPKDKAQKLFNNFENVVIDEVDNYYSRRDLSKQCALVAVDEIINNDGFARHDDYLIEYWQQVKQEIENL